MYYNTVRVFPALSIICVFSILVLSVGCWNGVFFTFRIVSVITINQSMMKINKIVTKYEAKTFDHDIEIILPKLSRSQSKIIIQFLVETPN